MYPNDSLDSDEDEIAVHTTYKVYLLKYFQSQSQAESVWKNQQTSFIRKYVRQKK